ncbi:MAG: hypothetical protein ACKO2P_19200 [Planctomycetota bacterium]
MSRRREREQMAGAGGLNTFIVKVFTEGKLFNSLMKEFEVNS